MDDREGRDSVSQAMQGDVGMSLTAGEVGGRMPQGAAGHPTVGCGGGAEQPRPEQCRAASCLPCADGVGPQGGRRHAEGDAAGPRSGVTPRHPGRPAAAARARPRAPWSSPSAQRRPFRGRRLRRPAASVPVAGQRHAPSGWRHRPTRWSCRTPCSSRSPPVRPLARSKSLPRGTIRPLESQTLSSGRTASRRPRERRAATVACSRLVLADRTIAAPSQSSSAGMAYRWSCRTESRRRPEPNAPSRWR